jgi:hypothetical protein
MDGAGHSPQWRRQSTRAALVVMPGLVTVFHRMVAPYSSVMPHGMMVPYPMMAVRPVMTPHGVMVPGLLMPTRDGMMP